jgi:hypothetical protein
MQVKRWFFHSLTLQEILTKTNLKVMKNKLLKSFKIGILTFGLLLLFCNCEKNDDIVSKELQQERTVTEISFEEFKSKTNLSNQTENLGPFFDINKPSSKSSINDKNTSNFSNATILKDNIIKIRKDNFTTYTFTILAQTENDEFYNLVLYVNNNQEIYKSYILKYIPSKKWLTDTSQHFSGNVKIVNNDIFNTGNLLQSKSSISSKSSQLDYCIDDVIITYECSHGREGHREGNPGRPSCTADEFYVYLDIISSPCSGSSGGDGGNFDPNISSGTSTSGGGNDNDNGIVTAPNTVPYTWELKNFESGKLSKEERNYYHSDPQSNIKSTIDWHLILNNFSTNSQNEAQAALNFGDKLNLNFHQFNWVFNNRDSEELLDIKSYLNEIIIVTPEIESFLKEVIDSEIETNNSTEVDFDYRVIEDKSFKNNPCLKGVYDKLGGAVTYQYYLKKFGGNFSVANLKLSTAVHPNYPLVNAVTIAPKNYMINIMFNPNNLGRPQLDIARTFIHELLHAEIYRKLLSCANLPNVNINNYTNTQWQTYINNLKNNFPGLFDYYMRYEYSVPKGQQISDAQHQVMAQHYRQIIVEVLKQFDNNIHSDEIYNSLAWIGLMGEGQVDSTTGLPQVPSVAWNKLPQDQRLQILSTYKNFIKTNVSCQ